VRNPATRVDQYCTTLRSRSWPQSVIASVPCARTLGAPHDVAAISSSSKRIDTLARRRKSHRVLRTFRAGIRALPNIGERPFAGPSTDSGI
jgi:hypothetical protein